MQLNAFGKKKTGEALGLLFSHSHEDEFSVNLIFCQGNSYICFSNRMLLVIKIGEYLSLFFSHSHKDKLRVKQIFCPYFFPLSPILSLKMGEDLGSFFLFHIKLNSF